MMSNYKPRHMPRALEKAVKTNDLAKVKSILANKKYQQREWLNSVNARGRTALLLALKYKSMDVVNYLLSLPDMNLHIYDPYGQSLLYLCREFPALFLQVLNDPRTPIPKNYAAGNLLHYFIIRNDIEMMRAILEKGVDVNCNYGSGRSILSCAIENRTACVKFLLGQKGNVDFQKYVSRFLEDSACPMLAWLQNINPPLYRKILNLASTLIIFDSYKVRIRINLVDAVNVLIADPDFDLNMNIWNGKTWNGKTLLTMAVTYGHDDLLPILVDCPRVNIHQQDQFGHIALTQAAEIGRTDLVDLMMNHPRFDVSATYRHNQTLLMLAAEKDYKHLVERLLDEEKFPVNAVDNEGNSALILLAKHHKNADDASLFIKLLEHGADTSQRNKNGINAIMAAENSGLKGIASDLKFYIPRQQHDDSAPAPSAPPLDDKMTAAIAEAANKPPQFSQSGLFASNSSISMMHKSYPPEMTDPQLQADIDSRHP